MKQEFYIISYKHSSQGVLTFWGANNAGYTTDLKQAGRYSKQEVDQKFTYYNNGYKEGKRLVIENIAVDCEEVEKDFEIRHMVERDANKYIEFVERLRNKNSIT